MTVRRAAAAVAVAAVAVLVADYLALCFVAKSEEDDPWQ